MELKPLEIHKDERGSFIEAFRPDGGQVSYIVVNPHQSRGDHYHMRKTEVFLVISGSAIMTVRDRESGDVIKVEVNGTKPITMRIVPNNTHSLTATSEGCIVLVWSDELFNEKDPDTYGEEI